MTRDEIINKVVANNDYKKICLRIAGEQNLADDLYQELMIIIIEYKHSIIETAYNNNQLDFFIIRIAANMCRNKYHPFYKGHIEFGKRISEQNIISEILHDDIASKIQHEKNIEALNKEIESIEKEYNGQYPYEIEMLKAYVKAGSYRKLEAITGINWDTCKKTVAKLKKRIRANVSITHV